LPVSKKLRDSVCSRLKIKPRQLLNRVNTKAIEAGIADRDVALLVLAHEQGLAVNKPRFDVPSEKLQALNDYLRTQKIAPVILPVTGPAKKKGAAKGKAVTFKRLMNFKGKYPEIFYDRLEEEINIAYSNPNLPNAALMLSRKLIENLVYNLLEYKFSKQKRIDLYYDVHQRRAHDFSVLLKNLQTNKSQYDIDQLDIIDKFLETVKPFKRDANSKVHKVIEYLDSTSQLDKFQIPEMTQMLLKLIDRVK
jgi:hypothetical protein